MTFAVEKAWREFLDAIREADFVAEEIAMLPDGDPEGRKPGLVQAWRDACSQRDAARERVRQFQKANGNGGQS